MTGPAITTATPAVANPFAFYAAVAAGWFALSLLWRLAARRPVFAQALPGARFREGWASLRSGTGLLARVSTARNCVQVQVTADGGLRTTPHFPITLGFVAELYGIDHVLPRSALRSARVVGRGGFRDAVELQAVDGRGRPLTLQLLMRRGQALVAALDLPEPV